MRRFSSFLMLCLMLMVLAACASDRPALVPRDEALMDLAFLTGAWVTEIDSGKRTEELWTTPDGGTMLGINRTIAIGADEEASRRTVAFEFLRLEHTGEGEIVYVAAPDGGAPTAFPLVDADPEAHRCVFENPDHDFPRRIIYQAEPGGRLRLRIEGTQDGREAAREWLLRRAYIRLTPTKWEEERDIRRELQRRRHLY